MPQKGRRSEWEGEDNRSKIFWSLFEEPKNFTTLLKTTGLSRSTLSLHLKNLLEEDTIEKAIKNGKVVYQTTLNEEKWLAQIKRTSFDYALAYLYAINPEMGGLVIVMSKMLVRLAINKRKKVLELGRPLSTDEFLKLGRESTKQMDKEFTELSKDPEKFAKAFLPVSLDVFTKILEASQKFVEMMEKVKKND